jgi:processive 1,2-diacylglycerol beta-glucosyltransferase
MKKYLFFGLAIFFTHTPYTNSIADLHKPYNGARIKQNNHDRMVNQTKLKKKKILIFSSKGGGGHTAVAKALHGYLKDDYHITTVNACQDVLSSFDIMQFLTFWRLTGEDFYNFCLQCRWITLLDKFISIGCWGIKHRKEAIEQVILDFVKKQRPDLIISVMPIINFIILHVAQKLNIPFLVLTNDLDTTNYIYGLHNPSYHKFYYTIPFDDSAIRSKIAPAGIPTSQIKVTGFPLRPEFFKEKDKQRIRADFKIPDDKPTIMILMGGVGSMASLRYVKTLARMNLPIHVIVCLGRNEKLRRNINRVILPSHITLSVIGFTDRIADLMAVSDVLITKPGPGSICEAIESDLPIIVDNTYNAPWWEIMNKEFVYNHSFGDILMSFNELKPILTKYIKNPSYIAKIKHNMVNFKKEQFANHKEHFGQTIKSLIGQIIQPTS